MRLKWAHAKFLEWCMAHSINSVSTSSIIIPKFISIYSLPLWLPTQIVSQPFWTTCQSLNKLHNFVPLPVICLPRRLSCSIFFPQPLGGPSPGTFPEPLRLGWVPCGKHMPHLLLSPSVHHDGIGCSLGGCSLQGGLPWHCQAELGAPFHEASWNLKHISCVLLCCNRPRLPLTLRGAWSSSSSWLQAQVWCPEYNVCPNKGFAEQMDKVSRTSENTFNVKEEEES